MTTAPVPALPASVAATLGDLQAVAARFAAWGEQMQRVVAAAAAACPRERGRKAHAARVTVRNAAQAAERRRALAQPPDSAEHGHQWPPVSDLRAARRALVGPLHQGCAPNYRQQATQQKGLALTE